ncbi:MAG: LL-diaminopimelate aminotransferase [Thermosediminibacterales bacterium]|nr:LL-diaminopimelate aminotransferase [Thermosediminibacterales bacterium]
MRFAERMKYLSSAIFSQLAEKKIELEKKGKEIINLSVGSPDMAPAPHIIKALQDACADTGNYAYALKDTPELLLAVKEWYKRRFDVELDEQNEVMSLLGSQDGLAHIALTLVDPGDIVLVPDPGYPIFSVGPLIAGAELVKMPLKKENGFLVDFDSIDKNAAKKAKLMIVSYPGNPVTAMATEEFYKELIDFAKKYDIVVLHDNAYCELTFDGLKTGSFLSYPGAKDVGVEFNSLSKTYNMAGCRIGFALGNREVIKQLSTIKSHMDYGLFLPLQKAAVAALTGPQDQVKRNAETYQRRRDILVDGLKKLGWEIDKPKATMFVWAPIPEKFSSSTDFTMSLMEKAGVMVVPGISFGELGEGYVRIALVQPEEKIQEAVDRIADSGLI